MLDDMRVNDEQLHRSNIQQLENADRVAAFFHRLRYDITKRTNIPDYTVLGMGGEDMRQAIHRIERIGEDPTTDGDIVIYLFEVRSVTAKLRNDIARRFRERSENALLVLTKDYQELEFVLLERVISKSQSRSAALKQAIRPIPLTVNRLKPDPIALRVLKRFTFTEEDAAYQWEKLRSAYMLAEWSEEYFNNRALFSDYYLKERLTDEQITPEWREDVKPIGQEIFRHLATARKNYTRQRETVIRKGLFEPVFRLLGFDLESRSDSSEADYLLYAPGDQSKPIAAALTYVWNRNLDDVDETRELGEADGGTPFEIPGAQVVSLLEKQTAPWVIVTNGKLWRLYSSTASNKATNYYEIDLEEAIAANEQIKALKYWWLMFRRQAFTGFLDKLLKNSADYAKELGDRLKDRVFVEIFPQFAKGFIADMQSKGVKSFDETTLAAVYSGTLTFLYRLMFILYAESLDLMPLNEVHGYRERSLYRLKQEIAAAGGTLIDQPPKKLTAHYKTNSTALYDRLREIFTIIDAGSDELNMPTYNGGLFSQETDSGQFLTRYSIPDQYLALGLDRLTRDIDQKTQALVFIDFKSLGVRQLGSIYEGLLEFKLKIASEALAVTKEKGKEVYKPAKQAKNKKPVATLAKGAVYLENDKQERKATGSYYTPDYIVKYIVRHTVEPVLEHKFKALENRLHKAQKGYRDFAKLQEARRKSGNDQPLTVYWNSSEMQQLVDDCLNVRVLDPAMGSGHFLVEVVDYISNRLIDFLNGWTENPVWAFLEQTRQDILDDMERQHVTIDADRLTRVALLKRAVLKRCIYGVDLNPMAVELAKVSLWLDAFTLGAPLSFLDHHLKHGNSLIGARIADVQSYLNTQAGETADMFSGSKFAGVMLATDLMRQVSYLSDNTIQQTRRSAQAYRDARDHLAPYKRLLDVYTSRWFGNGTAKKVKTDNVRLFLKQRDVEAWLKNPEHKLDDRLIPANQIAKTALQAAADKRFFHWELEFPEVFFAPSTPGGQDVQLSKDGGFDAVVGNPPYVSSRNEDIYSEAKSYVESNFETAFYQIDLYYLFIERAVTLANSNWAYVIPDTWIASVKADGFRKWILTNGKLSQIVISDKAIFEATVDCLIAIGSDKGLTSLQVTSISEDKGILNCGEIERPVDGKQIILSINTKVINVLSKLVNSPVRLADVSYTGRGIGAYHHSRHSKEIIEQKAYHSTHKKDDTYRPELRGESIGRYSIEWDGTNWISYGDWLSEPREPIFFEGARIFCRKIISDQLICTFTDDDWLVNQQIYIACDFQNFDARSVAAIVGSNLIGFFVRKLHNEEGAFPHLRVDQFRDLPLPNINFTTPIAERERLTQEAIAAYDIGDNAGVMAQASAALDAGKSDVVHDLLAHLAQCMIDLNKQKQAEVKRFLGWLEGRLWHPHPKSLSHKGRGTSKHTAVSPPLPAQQWERGQGGEGQTRLDIPSELAKRMTEVARMFRKEPTRSEDILWQALRNRQLEGRKFRRQQPIGAFVLDFFCAEERLAVEVDGNIHETQQEADHLRQELIEETGIRFVRVAAETVERDLDSALAAIRAAFLPSAHAAVGEGSGVRGGIDSLTGKTIIQGYLGDYQKGEGELPWREFRYRLYQNRNRFAVALTDVESEIEREYEKSLEALRPIKAKLARTDALIDKIVYRLYGLTDAEIELIERPRYEQALTDAKAQVIADDKITDDEEKIEKIAEGILPTAQHFFERVEKRDVKAALDGDLPNWRSLPPDAPTFMLTGDYNLRELPDHMDFSASVIPYTKAVEVALRKLIFEPFRTSHSDRDCRNEFLQKFMRGEKELTLGSYMIILSSSSETALRGFISRIVRDAEVLATTLNDTAIRNLRNKAAHEDVLTRDEAQQVRAWAIGILGMV